MELIDKINDLKKRRNAVILAHFYQLPEIQDIADFVGDSLELSRKAKDTTADVIVFCGVYFMAENAKILSPDKTVLLPHLYAGCPMADMITPEDVASLRAQHPAAAVVCYVNSSAAVKAASDICCTSSNAVKVVSSLPEKEIIFIPDKNLGHYVSRFVKDKRFILFDGWCHVHNDITVEDVEKARRDHPHALLLVHPECIPEVVDRADFTGSTSQIIDYAVKSDSGEFVIGTESGILYRLTQLCPRKRFFKLSGLLVCPNMKKTSLQSVFNSLEKMENRIEIDEKVMKGAAESLNRMLSL
ncbi:MAG: quinolinate synthase NadA [Bacillota bacterium]|nr:quinolinate synthase NadA [Bacillota bacterium]